MSVSSGLITFEAATRIVDEAVQPLPPETVPLSAALGRVSASDVVTRLASPPWDNSAVDGFGVNSMPEGSLKVIGSVQAGEISPQPVAAGEAVRIFTGAPIPPGVTAVAMQEDCALVADRLYLLAKPVLGDHIRRSGSDFPVGVPAVSRGQLLTPSVIGLLASAGHAQADVFRLPRVTILTTGNELQAVGRELGPGQIPNSNSAMMTAAVGSLGIPAHHVHVQDDLEATIEAVDEALRTSDLLITCGGVSVGSYDYLREALSKCGVDQLFWGVKIKPGKPVYFGRRGSALVFGLPGNPVSALVTFALFAQPALRRLMGTQCAFPEWRAATLRNGAVKKAGRAEFLRARLCSAASRDVEILGGQGSHMIRVMAEANSLVQFPAMEEQLRPGDHVQVTTLSWGVL